MNHVSVVYEFDIWTFVKLGQSLSVFVIQLVNDCVHGWTFVSSYKSPQTQLSIVDDIFSI